MSKKLKKNTRTFGVIFDSGNLLAILDEFPSSWGVRLYPEDSINIPHYLKSEEWKKAYCILSTLAEEKSDMNIVYFNMKGWTDNNLLLYKFLHENFGEKSCIHISNSSTKQKKKHQQNYLICHSSPNNREFWMECFQNLKTYVFHFGAFGTFTKNFLERRIFSNLDVIRIINFIIQKTLNVKKKQVSSIEILPLSNQIKTSLSFIDIVKIISGTINNDSSNSKYVFRSHPNNPDVNFFVENPKTYLFIILLAFTMFIIFILISIRNLKRMKQVTKIIENHQEKQHQFEEDNEKNLDYSKKIYLHTPKEQKKTISEIIRLKV